MKKLTEVERLLVDLVNIESISGNELKACDYVYNYLKKHGFKLVKIPVHKRGYNIMAEVGKPRVYLSAHLDTVPPFFPAKATDKEITGRGVIDAKGSAAAMLVAAVASKIQGLTNFGLLFTVEEETECSGARKIAEKRIKLPFVVVGEPTNSKLLDSNWGLFEARLVATAKPSYGSTGQGPLDAVDKLMKALNLLYAEFLDRKLFPKTAVYNISTITAGQGRNTAPARAEALLDFTIPPGSKLDYLKTTKKLLGKYVRVEHLITWPAVKFKVPKELNFLPRSEAGNFSTDLSFLGSPGVILGPGMLERAHTPKERISRKELEKAVKAYYKIIENYQS